ncbi:hypothetical protein BGAL_0066g00300 [Botrytis galanthina]|uniref:DUF7918 domain-containing protein n=1 Tax=Botrytis galanthina TaxID=278940 RepID=A0A4S8R5M4_9HELO|nr:hypothetical protein BGAL_0066g00300 [Botrytis galanthina]
MLNEPGGLGKKFEVTRNQRSVTVRKFVESTAGKFFTIKCSVKTPYRYAGASQWDNSTEAAIRLDGNGRYVGEIEVRVFREMSPSNASLVSTAPLVSKTEIPENLLKGQAKSHSTLFSHGEVEKEGKYVRMKRCDGGREYPIAIFNFQYGSRGWRDLEALGAIERIPELEPESSFGLGHNFEPLPMPMSEVRAPVKLFRDTIMEAEAEAKLSNEKSRGGSTYELQAIRLSPPSIKHEVQDAEHGQNSTRTAPSVPAGTSNVTSPVISASWNLLDLDPTQTGQLLGQFLQYLQTQGGGQPSQAPPPLPVRTTSVALPNLPSSTNSSEIATTATLKPPEDDSDDDVVIDLDSD